MRFIKLSFRKNQNRIEIKIKLKKLHFYLQKKEKKRLFVKKKRIAYL